MLVIEMKYYHVTVNISKKDIKIAFRILQGG